MKLKTAVLLIGFGGPTSMAEVRPFLKSVLDGVKIPQVRFDEVMHHYEVFNGVSPYNEITRKQKDALENWFEAKGESMPVYIGLRHAMPSFKETFEAMKREGAERAIGFVLSPFRCFASFEKYVEKVNEGRVAAGATSLVMEYTDNFFDHPLFLGAQGDKVKLILDRFSKAKLERTFFIFSSHSIPVPMSDESGYADQFLKVSSSIANALGMTHWACGYQSRSGNPTDPWLLPDVKEVIQRIDRKKFQNMMLVPVGFLCDNVEVLYDLDVEAKKTTEDMGLKYFRAQTVMDHPRFIELMGTQVLKKLGRSLP